MQIKVQEEKAGLHPREAVVIIETLSGPEELIVDRRSEPVNFVDVGYPIAVHGPHYLVELPSETSKGAWRVWVSEDNVLQNILEAAE